jgi:hypothetical protein
LGKFELQISSPKCAGGPNLTYHGRLRCGRTSPLLGPARVQAVNKGPQPASGRELKLCRLAATSRRSVHLSQLCQLPGAQHFYEKPQCRVASLGWITAADVISGLATGTHWDITATDQIKPIATTTAIPIPMRICSPLRHVELGEIGLTYFFGAPM